MSKEDRGELVIVTRQLKQTACSDADREQRIVLLSTVAGYPLPSYSGDGCEDFQCIEALTKVCRVGNLIVKYYFCPKILLTVSHTYAVSSTLI